MTSALISCIKGRSTVKGILPPVGLGYSTSRHANKTCIFSCSALSMQGEAESVKEKRLGKRKVALFVGYEGTRYRGLQIQPSQRGAEWAAQVPSLTVEDVLEDAIYKSGGILESNRGSLGKIGWCRSSRTDKRVHSLSTVISLKLECDPEVFESEPDGASIVSGINAHLPDDVMVFSVQRVVKSFDARRECIRRYYEYYIPVSFLSLAKREAAGSIDDVIDRLGDAWRSYEGYHAFHNFTKRRLYRQKRHSGQQSSVTSSSDDGDDDDDDDTREDTEDHDAVHDTSERAKGRITFEWKDERDDNDPIVRSHYRYVEDCTSSNGLVELVEHGGVPCVKLAVCGGSFMLHQIRHMVAGAVMVGLGIIPPELLRAAVAPPVRMNLPRAPPGTLVLRDADFGKFRKSYDGKPSPTQRASGDSLILLDGGVERQREFASRILYPGLNEQLQHEDWEQWHEQLSLVHYDETMAEYVVRKSEEWFERRDALKEERRQKRAEREARLFGSENTSDD